MALDYKAVGIRIKDIRKEKGYTQKDLSKTLGVTTAFISRIETGTCKISIKRLVQICEYLKIPLNYVLTGTVEVSDDYLIEDFNKTLKKCGPERQRLILDIAKLVSKMK